MPRTPVLCLPFAGASAAAFRRCQEAPARHLRVVPVELPGHAERFAEPLCTSVGEAVEGLCPYVLGLLDGERRVALFGHSLGAVLAFELALRLAGDGEHEVIGLFVSGSPGPWTRRERRATGLSDDKFLERVEELAGFRHPALEDEELRELLLPALRADVEMHEAYLAVPGLVLDAPITSLRGRDDRLVNADEAREWSAATSRAFHSAELPGGHMYVADRPAELVRTMDECLVPLAPGR